MRRSILYRSDEAIFVSLNANPGACSSNSRRADSLVDKERSAITIAMMAGWPRRKTNMIALKDRDLFRQQALIGGNWRDANVKATVEVTDPASQQVLGTIPDMGRDETKAAIEAAADAFKRWKKKT